MSNVTSFSLLFLLLKSGILIGASGYDFCFAYSKLTKIDDPLYILYNVAILNTPTFITRLKCIRCNNLLTRLSFLFSSVHVCYCLKRLNWLRIGDFISTKSHLHLTDRERVRLHVRDPIAYMWLDAAPFCLSGNVSQLVSIFFRKKNMWKFLVTFSHALFLLAEPCSCVARCFLSFFQLPCNANSDLNERWNTARCPIMEMCHYRDEVKILKIFFFIYLRQVSESVISNFDYFIFIFCHNSTFF